jgi:2',3'-cyclic-nucleotide 2'-phosphodiesterase (5'-nucleotidase family)
VQETSLGDLVADSVCEAYGAQAALIPGGGLREASIPSGKVESADVLQALQYRDDPIVVVEVTGSQIVKALERSVSISPQRNLGFLQVSGISFGFSQGAKTFSRVSSVSVGGEAVSAEKRYRVAMTTALANGDYGYFTVWGGALKPVTNGQTMAQAVTKFLAGRGTLDYRGQNRIMKL